MIENQIDVSVYMLTYYHEKYIRQAIESVLAQKTHYKYEIVISDDYSQDGTRDILKEYQEKYPDIIRINLNDSNIGIPANIFKARTMCKGRYITALSGDDYWINENKIEVEISFLENNPRYVAVFNGIELRMDDEKNPFEIIPNDKSQFNREYTLSDYEKCKPLGTHGFFMRNYFLTEEGREYFAQAQKISDVVDDAVDQVLILRKGPVYVLDIITDAHRVFGSTEEKRNYNSRYSRLEKYNHHISLLNGMSELWSGEIDFMNWYAKTYAVGFLSMLACKDFKGYRVVTDKIPSYYKKPILKGIYVKAIPYMLSFISYRLKRFKGTR